MKKALFIFFLFTSTFYFSQWQYITTKNSSLLMTSNGTGYCFYNAYQTPSSGYKCSMIKTVDDWQSNFFVIQNWSSPSYPGISFSDMGFINDTIGFCHIHGQTDALYGTTNGGTLWNNSYFVAGSIGKVAFLRKDLLYVLDIAGSNLTRCIGNNSVTTLPTNVNIGYWPGLYFSNDTTGYIYGVNTSSINVLIKTNNAGINWVNQLSDTSNKFNKIHFPSNQVGYIAANNGKVFKTTDGGTSWIKLSLGTNNNLYALNFVNDTLGFVGGANGSIYKTMDGGISWQLENSTLTNDIIKIFFFKSGFVYAVSSSGQLIKRYIQVGLKEQKSVFKSIKVFPNPSSDHLIIESDQLLKGSSFSLINANGQEFIKQNINEVKSQVDISKLSKGIYYLKINSSEGVEVKKVIIE